MNTKGVFVPATLAMTASVLYILTLTSRERKLAGSAELVEVMVARTDIPERTVLAADLVDHVAIPRKYVAQDAFEYRIQSDVKMVENLVTQIRIAKGNQIQQAALLPLSPEAGLSTKVPPGYRALPIPVEPEFMSMIKPGDRVDIVVTFDAFMGQENRREKVTATILQGLLVLGVGKNLGQAQTAAQWQRSGADAAQASVIADKGAISVALNPLELQYLALAMKTGDVQVGLRGIGDVTISPIEMSTFRKLFH
ncbi:MAG: Flp pilus assembly protein CpaB [Elusimicrobia bacterium]|nr:Flp pilus assembly protein CpaB [Elusimicrobiota bacterium]